MDKNHSIRARKRLLDNLRIRFYNLVDYLTLFLYIFVIAICAVIVDYFLVVVLEYLFSVDIQRYPTVSQFFAWYKIGSAILVFIVAFVHSIVSTYSQIKFEIENVKND